MGGCFSVDHRLEVKVKAEQDFDERRWNREGRWKRRWKYLQRKRKEQSESVYFVFKEMEKVPGRKYPHIDLTRCHLTDFFDES